MTGHQKKKLRSGVAGDKDDFARRNLSYLAGVKNLPNLRGFETFKEFRLQQTRQDLTASGHRMEPSFTQFYRRTTHSQFVKVLRTPAFNAENRTRADSRFSLTQLARQCEFYGQVEPQQFLLM